MGQDLSYNAPGLAILQQANRYLQLDPTGAKIGLLALLAPLVLLLLAPRFLGRVRCVARRRGVGAAVVAWNLTGEISFASASNRTSDRFVENIRDAFTWVDDNTGGAPTLYIGQQMPDQNGEWLLEFWNRSIKAVWSLDGTAQGPGPFLTPDPRRRTGLSPHDPGLSVRRRGGRHRGRREDGGARTSTRRRRARAVAPGQGDPPLRLRASVDGVYPDGWMGSSSSYTRYSTEGNKPRRIRIASSPGTTGAAPNTDRARHGRRSGRS